MSVQENVEYGLRVKRVSRGERRRRAEEALERVRLSGFGSRRPHQLSGGQRQRVALARALVNRPRVLLLDEPLGALDLKLRREMQMELKQIQREVGITFVFVTHDQEEALTLSERIAVFNDGRIEQVAAPVELYERPATSFVAGFVGTSNLLHGDVAQRLLGGPGPFSIRPEKIHLGAEGDPVPDDAEHVTVPGTVADVVYLGSATHSVVDLRVPGADGPTSDPAARLSVMQQNLQSSLDRALARRGQRVLLSWHRGHVVDLGRPGPGVADTQSSSSKEPVTESR
jgi:putative spermidine/putrescine transport system ATP-binding protein